jgi:cyclopropane-fatty-acyl-phospholipid synthase
VTTTLSAEQHRVATARVAAAGLSGRIDVRLDHYRDLVGTFDALVAVEMVEAVDWRELDDFFARCAELVGPHGAVGLQAIVTAAHREPLTRVGTDFIKTHVFPGGSLPSVPSMLDAAARRTDLAPVALSDFGLHYAETLRRWRANLAARRDDARALGLDDAFLRLWDFYLCYCEAGFEERVVSVVQLVLERPGRSPSLQR